MKFVRPAEALSHCREAGDVSGCAGRAIAPTQQEPTRRGYRYVDVKWQKSVRRISRPGLDPSKGAADLQGASRGTLRSRADARRGGSEATRVRVTSSRSRPEKHARHLGGATHRDSNTTEGVPAPRAAQRKSRRAGGLGRAGQTRAQGPKGPGERASFPAGVGTGEAVPARTTKDVRDGRGHQARAAPADEARAVCLSKRREALALRSSYTGSSVCDGVSHACARGSREPVHRSWPNANSWAIQPNPSRANGSGF